MLRLRQSQFYSLQDIQDSYVQIVSQLRDEIKKETEEKLVDWVKEELLNIMMVLRYKMERKIYMDELTSLKEELGQPS